jgi:hypothetical protein
MTSAGSPAMIIECTFVSEGFIGLFLLGRFVHGCIICDHNLKKVVSRRKQKQLTKCVHTPCAMHSW